MTALIAETLRSVLVKNTKIMESQLIESYEAEGYENRPLSVTEISRMLEAHGNVFTLIDGVLNDYSNDAFGIDVSNWTLFDAFNHINY